MITKILEVLSNALSVISNFTSNIFRYAKKIDIKSS